LFRFVAESDILGVVSIPKSKKFPMGNTVKEKVEYSIKKKKKKY